LTFEKRSNIRYYFFMNTTQIKLTSIGNSVGAIFPKELLEKLRVSNDDTLTVSETLTGLLQMLSLAAGEHTGESFAAWLRTVTEIPS